MVDLLFVVSLPSLCVGLCVESLFYNVVLSVLSRVAIILMGKRKLIAVLQMYSYCHVAVYILCFFLVVS